MTGRIVYVIICILNLYINKIKKKHSPLFLDNFLSEQIIRVGDSRLKLGWQKVVHLWCIKSSNEIRMAYFYYIFFWLYLAPIVSANVIIFVWRFICGIYGKNVIQKINVNIWIKLIFFPTNFQIKNNYILVTWLENSQTQTTTPQIIKVFLIP